MSKKTKAPETLTHGTLIPERLSKEFVAPASKNFVVHKSRSVQATSSTSAVFPDDDDAAGKGRIYSESICSANALQHSISMTDVGTKSNALT